MFASSKVLCCPFQQWLGPGARRTSGGLSPRGGYRSQPSRTLVRYMTTLISAQLGRSSDGWLPPLIPYTRLAMLRAAIAALAWPSCSSSHSPLSDAGGTFSAAHWRSLVILAPLSRRHLSCPAPTLNVTPPNGESFSLASFRVVYSALHVLS